MARLTRDQQIESLRTQIEEWKKLGFADNNEELRTLREQLAKLELEKMDES